MRLFGFSFLFSAEEIMQPKSLVIHHTTTPVRHHHHIIVVVVVQQRCKQEKEIMER
jgi:hypothetical protein